METSKTIEIRKASIDDLTSIVHLFDSYRQFYEQKSDTSSAKAFIEERLRKNESVVFIASDENADVGFVQLYPSFSSVSMQRTWILNDMLVLSAARRKGIGSGLLKKVREFAQETNAKCVALETAPDNIPAQELYKKHGFEIDDEYLNFSMKI